ncbi:MAG TPA: hypothetical protein VJY15_15990 [Candidatus Acidoferrum sp.]|nr:hypothetical protein [Candidatus Acidoferrum sp.]
MFWKEALANFVGSLSAAIVVWFLVTRFYELPRSKGEKRELLAISYGLIKRELDAALQYCVDLLQSRPGEIYAVFPVTQAWDTLHSIETFRYLPPRVSEKLVMCYSLLFRLKGHVEFRQWLFLSNTSPSAKEVLSLRMRSQADQFAKQVARESQEIVKRLLKLIDAEVSELDEKQRRIFQETYETGSDR